MYYVLVITGVHKRSIGWLFISSPVVTTEAAYNRHQLERLIKDDVFALKSFVGLEHEISGFACNSPFFCENLKCVSGNLQWFSSSWENPSLRFLLPNLD